MIIVTIGLVKNLLSDNQLKLKIHAFLISDALPEKLITQPTILRTSKKIDFYF